MKRFVVLAIVICLSFCSISAEAHPGGLDSAEGHVDRQDGTYHYHCKGYPAHQHHGGICPYRFSESIRDENSSGSNGSSSYYEPIDVFYTSENKIFHWSKKCPYLIGAKSVYEGDVSDVVRRGYTKCGTCSRIMEYDSSGRKNNTGTTFDDLKGYLPSAKYSITATPRPTATYRPVYTESPSATVNLEERQIPKAVWMFALGIALVIVVALIARIKNQSDERKRIQAENQENDHFSGFDLDNFHLPKVEKKDIPDQSISWASTIRYYVILSIALVIYCFIRALM